MSQTRNIYGIDALRFFSALLVMAFHLSYLGGIPGSTAHRISGGFSLDWAEGSTSVGRIGVQIFFVISGFVIAYSTRDVTPRQFLESRLLRLVPAAWICASITFLICLLFDTRGPYELGKAWLKSVLFVPFGPYIDGSYWTLAIECAFYAVVLTIIVLRAQRFTDHILLAIASISLAFHVMLLLLPEHDHLSGNRYLQLALVVHGGEFAVGVFLRALLMDGGSKLRWVGILVALTAGTIDTAKFLTLKQDIPLGLVIWFGSILCIVWSVQFNDRIASVLGERGKIIVRALGLATYPLYRLHDIVGAAIISVLVKLSFEANLALGLTFALMIVFAFGLATRAEPAVRQMIRPKRQVANP